jgi:hypothetical protein
MVIIKFSLWVYYCVQHIVIGNTVFMREDNYFITFIDLVSVQWVIYIMIPLLKNSDKILARILTSLVKILARNLWKLQDLVRFLGQRERFLKSLVRYALDRVYGTWKILQDLYKIVARDFKRIRILARIL